MGIRPGRSADCYRGRSFTITCSRSCDPDLAAACWCKFSDGSQVRHLHGFCSSRCESPSNTLGAAAHGTAAFLITLFMAITRRAFTCGAAAALAAVARPDTTAAAPYEQHHANDLDLSLGWELHTNEQLVQNSVTLPNSAAHLSWHQWQPASWEKIWTYRRKLDLPGTSRQHRYFLHIERALGNANVIVNGRHIGSHKGGFTPFECEVTEAIRNGFNQIEIEVDSTWVNVPPSGSPRGPASVDYYLPGGLTGNVTLADDSASRH